MRKQVCIKFKVRYDNVRLKLPGQLIHHAHIVFKITWHVLHVICKGLLVFNTVVFINGIESANIIHILKFGVKIIISTVTGKYHQVVSLIY